ncbi:MAG: VPLPA-CTERM sorting domain-containing protein [Pseudomonadota bacterium]
MKSLKFLASIGAAAAVLGVSAQGANVVQNGTFDDTSAWMGSFTPQPGTSSFPDIDTGSYYWGGRASFNQISQRYDFSASDTLALNTSGLAFTMSADLFGYSTQGDWSSFEAVFVDAGDNTLGNALLSSVDGDPGTWPDPLVAGTGPNFQSTTGTIPLTTVAIKFFVSSTRVAGISNDGYLDNALFDLRAASGSMDPVPVPAALPLMAFGVAGLGVMRRRRRS